MKLALPAESAAAFLILAVIIFAFGERSRRRQAVTDDAGTVAWTIFAFFLGVLCLIRGALGLLTDS